MDFWELEEETLMQNQQNPQQPQYPPYPPYPQYPTAGKPQSNKVVIIVLIVAGAVGLLLIVLFTLFVVMRRPIVTQLYDLRCKNNLKQFDTALALYRNDYNQKYPDYSGVKFIAVLYRTGYLVEKKYYLCPAREDADWVETGDNKTAFKFEKPAAGEPYSENWNPQFMPQEITYAGRRNDPNDEGGRFCLPNGAMDPTPIVSDNTLGPTGDHDKKYAPHGGGGEVNVLLTNGSIVKLKDVTVGVRDPSQKMDLECLMDDNDGRH